MPSLACVRARPARRRRRGAARRLRTDRGSAIASPGLVPWIARRRLDCGVLVVVARHARSSARRRALRRPVDRRARRCARRRARMVSRDDAVPSTDLENVRAVRDTRCPRSGPRNGAARVVALLAWIAVRAAMLLVEVSMRPLYAWDAWSAWATKAKTFFAMHTIVPFVDLRDWTSSTTPVWFDAQPCAAGDVAAAAGVDRDRDRRLGRRERRDCRGGCSSSHSCSSSTARCDVRGAAAALRSSRPGSSATLPLLGTQVALAGYADLPLAAAFTLGSLAGVRAIAHARADRCRRRRRRARVARALQVVGLGVDRRRVARTRRGGARPAVAPAHRRAGRRSSPSRSSASPHDSRMPRSGRSRSRTRPVWDLFAVDGVLLANWHLVALGIVGTLVLRRRRVLDAADITPLTFIARRRARCGSRCSSRSRRFRWWGADYSGLNRAVLVLVPFAIAGWPSRCSTPRGTRRNPCRSRRPRCARSPRPEPATEGA